MTDDIGHPLLLRVDCDEPFVSVTLSDGRRARLHPLWLRDNCACSSCRHPRTWERVFDTVAIDPSLQMATAKMAPGRDGVGMALYIEWPDGHRSEYSAAWLSDHLPDQRRAWLTPGATTLWGSELLGSMPRCNFRTLHDGSCLLEFLESLQEFGVTIVDHTPPTAEALADLADQVGTRRATNFGPHFEVVAMVQPNNNAYTAIELYPHSDLPNWEAPPGIQFLHCLVAEAPGGESVLVDGFAIADSLRRDDPAAFELLRTTAFPYRFNDATDDIRWRSPIIHLDANGDYHEIRYHTGLAAPLDCDPDQMEAVYLAYIEFGRRARSAEFQVRFRLEEGEVMVFHNRRVLHGRAAFDPAGGCRHLRGCYVDADDLRSRIRTMRGDNLR